MPCLPLEVTHGWHDSVHLIALETYVSDVCLDVQERDEVSCLGLGFGIVEGIVRLQTIALCLARPQTETLLPLPSRN